MPQALPPGAAAGGVVAALVSTLLQEPRWSLPPAVPQELLWPEERSWHLPSLLAGILLGLLLALAQLLDVIYLFRQALATYVKTPSWSAYNATLIKGRLA